MTGYAAFLRGINLGPANKVAMPTLREVAESLGWEDVATYINSGNVVFASPKEPSTLARELEAGLHQRLGKPIEVAVRSRGELQQIVAENPYPDGDPGKVTVAFLMAALPERAPEAIASLATGREPFSVRGAEIYVHYQDGLGRSKLAERFSSVIKVSATTRTIGTVTKVLARIPG